MAGRATEIVKQKRLRQVMDMIGQGYYRFDIVTKLSEEWGCRVRRVDAYIRYAKDVISKEVNSQDATDTLNKLDYLYNQAMIEKDRKSAVQVQAIKAKYTLSQKHDVTINDTTAKFPDLDEDSKPD